MKTSTLEPDDDRIGIRTTLLLASRRGRPCRPQSIRQCPRPHGRSTDRCRRFRQCHRRLERMASSTIYSTPPIRSVGIARITRSRSSMTSPALFNNLPVPDVANHPKGYAQTGYVRGTKQ